MLNYSDFGTGKSTRLSTFPKPMIVFMFDGRGKEMPYLKLGKNVEIDAFTTDVLDKKGNLLIRVERYLELNPLKPVAYEQFLVRMKILPHQRIDYSLAKENKARIVVAVITEIGSIRVTAVEEFVPAD